MDLMQKPDSCASACPDTRPTCDDVKKYTAEGGCAFACAPDLKKHATEHFCSPDIFGSTMSLMQKPDCASACPDTRPMHVR